MSQPNPIETFLLEAEDLLVQIEQSALDVLSGRGDDEAINLLFRAFHTIKGSGSMFGFEAVASFTHHIESALDRVRSGQLEMTPELVQLLLAAKDQIKALLEGADSTSCLAIIDHLEEMQGLSPSEHQPQLPISERREAEAAASPLVNYSIQFRPSARVAHSGLDPASLLDELRDLGECCPQLCQDQIPVLSELQPDLCYLSWRIRLTTDHGLNAIRDVFIFVEDDSEIAIDVIDPSTTGTCAERPTATVPPPAETVSVDSDPSPTATVSARKAGTAQASVRVPSEKLDRLVNLVGELVMNQSRLTQVSRGLDCAELASPVEAIERLVSELRDTVLGIRMMPIGSTFSRFRRLIHDLSHELGKDIALVTEGEETELDKTVLDQLGDPLVHLVRNSIDHGIEDPDMRAGAGKPRTGTIRMSAAHEGAQVTVTIQDDGKGLDIEKVKAKAVEKGLISPDANLSPSEACSLIFLPGFSTATQVTNVSGRGVGMDVVKRQVEALRGAISVSSERGRGTTITLTLPLTLAIIDGLLVEIGPDRFILPMGAVTENVELSRRERATNNGRNLISVRGDLVPYIRLRELFARADDGPGIEKVVIASVDGERIGFAVDRVLGSHQTVIQSLGRFYRSIEVASGATIMGDGRVALILDIPGMVRLDATRSQSSDRRFESFNFGDN